MNGHKEYVHVPNSGRLQELFTPHREVFLLPADKETLNERKTRYTLVMTRYGPGYVSVESTKVNDLFREAMENRVINEFTNHRIIGREKRIGMSRIDFLLEDPGGTPVYLEVKSATLVIDNTALFPDAPTVRGSKHLGELITMKDKGFEAAVAFVITRGDAKRFSPNDREDPEFGLLLREAFNHGVEIIAYKCRVNLEEIYITGPVPVIL